MAPGLPGEALNQRPVEQPADDRYQKKEPYSQPGQMQAGDTTLLSELLVPGGQPRKRKYQPPKPAGTDASTCPNDQSHHDQPES
ncbi:MAG TPA: hypothetical protein VNC61_04315 [Acidimicrobiales bacterium]|nr:hypothetical protein [Acidimicrobiales bacterium]